MKRRSAFMNFFKVLILQTFIVPFLQLNGQVKVTDGGNLAIDPNSLIEMESTNKGLLIPRFALNSLTLVTPLTGSVPAGMLIYSTGGMVPDGFYYWTGAVWTRFRTGITSTEYTTSSPLSKTANLVYASNDITLTLPSITAADDGLEITVKNVGIHTDLVTVAGNGSETIDGLPSVRLLHNWAKTFIARNSNWELKERTRALGDILDIGSSATFASIVEAVEFLNEHMNEHVTIRLNAELQNVSSTIVIDLPYPLTITGTTYGEGTFQAATGLTGNPMFRCLSECYFKMVIFDASTLPGYGSQPGEDAVRYEGSGTYNEIKDSSFEGFYNTVSVLTDAELWLFESDIVNSANTGLYINAPGGTSIVKVSETDFTDCLVGINLSAGTASEFTIMNGVFTGFAGPPESTCIIYNPASYTFNNIVITNNSWNYLGTGISGFDFSRTDGRDASAIIENNEMALNSTPHAYINVVNNTLTTTCTTANAWYRVNRTITSYIFNNFALISNVLTFLPAKTMDLEIHITGNVVCDNNNRNITIGIVKNGSTATIYGATTLRIVTSNQPFPYATVVFLTDVQKNDRIEFYCSSNRDGDILTFQDYNTYLIGH